MLDSDLKTEPSVSFGRCGAFSTAIFCERQAQEMGDGAASRPTCLFTDQGPVCPLTGAEGGPNVVFNSEGAGACKRGVAFPSDPTLPLGFMGRGGGVGLRGALKTAVSLAPRRHGLVSTGGPNFAVTDSAERRVGLAGRASCRRHGCIKGVASFMGSAPMPCPEGRVVFCGGAPRMGDCQEIAPVFTVHRRQGKAGA